MNGGTPLDRIDPIATTIGRVVAAQPDRAAIEWSGGALTASQLGSWAAHVAAELIDGGLRRGDHVAVAGGRTPGSVAALLGVLAAGGVMVPVDRALPAARRSLMLERSRATRVVTVGDDPLSGALPGVAIGDHPERDHHGSLMPVPRQPRDPAYLFFTSGTTGVPKGIVGTQLGLAQFIDWMASALDVTHADRVSLIRSLSFDASLREVFLPLATGATLVVGPDPLDPDDAIDWLARRRISVLNATPSHASVWLDAATDPVPTSLRWVCFSGERLDRGLVDRWRSTVAPSGTIANLYGPTETTMIRTFDVVADPIERDVLPVGRPLPHTRVHVVDPEGAACAVGEPGEVLIATEVGTLGYLDDPDSDRFGPEPGDTGATAYRTGDRGWFLEDGRLVVSGRLDDQVQILGVRIEPAEVAAVLAGHPDVDRAEVLAIADDRLGHQLIAFVRPSDGASPDPGVWRAHLVDRVMGPSIPSRFVAIDSFPLTSNGKVDRRALEALLQDADHDTIAAPKPFSTPERLEALSPVKRALLEARIGRASSPAPPATANRVEALSPVKRALLEARLRSAEQVTAPLGTGASSQVREAPTSFAQERLWFLDRLYPGRANYNIVQAHRLRGVIDREAMRVAFDRIHRRHEALRTRYIDRDGIPLQVVDPPGGGPFHFVDLTGHADPEGAADRLAVDESSRVFDLAAGPVWRSTLVRIAEADHVLVVATHHIASDGWSMPPLYRELSAGYAAAITGTEPDLPDLPIQYADYALRQRRHAESGAFEPDLTFWENELADSPDLVTLPTRRPRPQIQQHRGARYRFRCPRAAADRMAELAREHSATSFMVGLALFQAYVARVSGLSDIVVGIPSADRVSADTQDLVGFFVNSLAMRVRVAEDATFRDVLARVRDAAVRAYDHREVPFEHVVRRLHPARSTDRTPLFQLFFQFGLGAFTAQLELPDVEAERIDRETLASKFDLTMYLGTDEGVLSGSVIYNTDLFDESEVESLLEGFGDFAATVMSDPDRLLADLTTVVSPAPASAWRNEVVQSSTDIAGAEEIAVIWSEIFGKPVGIDDDFFDLGGHSLLAIRVFSRIEADLGRTLPIGSIFECPTPRGLAGVAAASVASEAAEPVAVAGAELSFAQRRLWFLHRLAPDAGNYHVPWRVRLQGGLSIEAISKAFDLVVERHAVLRTRVVEEEGVPHQVIDPPAHVPLDIVDLEALSDDVKPDRLRAVLDDEARRPFDLATDHPVRIRVVRLGAEDHVVSVVAHHIATDAESMAILRRELREIYSAFIEEREPGLRRLPIQYVDFARAQLERYADLDRAGVTSWLDTLATADPVFELTPDRVRPGRGGHDGDIVLSRLSERVTGSLIDVARDGRATPFMVLLAAFGVLLHRFSGEDDLLIGVPSTERTGLDSEDLIGFFVNSLPIRVDLTGEPSFREMVTRVRDRVVEALEHGDVPFEAIVDRLQVPRDPSRTPLFQVMFDMNQREGGTFELPGVETVPLGIRPSRRSAKFDLRLHCRLTGPSLQTLFEFRSDLFDRASIEVLSERFSALLTSFVEHPDEPVGRVPMGTDDDARINGEDAGCGWPEPVRLISRFHEIATTRGDAVAIDDGRQTITYAELAAGARSIGAELRRAGVGPGCTVGISMPRSSSLAAAILGTLEAGACYVPLDPDYPADRLEVMRRDAALTAIVHEGSRGPLSVEIESVPDGRRVVDPTDEVAYIMFTSGSTGRPKGVLVPERAVARLVLEPDYVSFEPGDVVAFASNTAFDAATFELWGALLNGARLRVLDRDTLGAPDLLAAEVERAEITTMFLTTALFNAVVAQKPDAFRTVRNLLVGGEAADVTAMRRCLEAGSPSRLVNVYGPTETTTFATWHEVTDLPESARTVPIGRPIGGTSIRILDGHGEQVPLGVPGELVIGGPGVALGYIGDDELTARRFVAGPDGRLEYRTGDRVRRRHDGAVEFLGRMDRQIKLRGFRIEPGEIESHLGSHEAVAESAVIPWKDAHGLRLAAYVVARSAVEPATLLDHLARRLPPFMVPSSLQVVEALPRTPNGKLDTDALPTPTTPTAPYVAPSGPAMTKMAMLWQEVLEVDRVGADDDFFALGGNSLLAIRLFAAMERTFGRSEPLSTLFEAPTLAALTARVTGESSHDGGTVPGVVTLRAGTGQTPLFCLPPAGGYVFVYEPMARASDGDRPIYGILAPGVDGREEPLRTVDDLAAHCVRKIVETQPDGPYLLLGYSLGGLIAWEVARRLTNDGRRVALLGLVDSRFGERLSLLGTLRRDVRLVRRYGRRGARAAMRATAASARLTAGKVRHGPAAWLTRVLGRPLSPLQAGRRITAAGRDATYAFTPRPYDGSVIYFRANPLKGSVSRRGVDRWRDAARGDFDVIEVPGSHKGSSSVMHDPNAAVLAKEIQRLLERDETDD